MAIATGNRVIGPQYQHACGGEGKDLSAGNQTAVPSPLLVTTLTELSCFNFFEIKSIFNVRNKTSELYSL